MCEEQNQDNTIFLIFIQDRNNSQFIFYIYFLTSSSFIISIHKKSVQFKKWPVSQTLRLAISDFCYDKINSTSPTLTHFKGANPSLALSAFESSTLMLSWKPPFDDDSECLSFFSLSWSLWRCRSLSPSLCLWRSSSLLRLLSLWSWRCFLWRLCLRSWKQVGKYYENWTFSKYINLKLLKAWRKVIRMSLLEWR